LADYFGPCFIDIFSVGQQWTIRIDEASSATSFTWKMTAKLMQM